MNSWRAGCVGTRTSGSGERTEETTVRNDGTAPRSDSHGFSLLPAVRATWAPRGRTPVLRHRFNWKRLSMAGALAYWPDRSQSALVFQLRPGAYNDVSLIEFLTDLHTHLDGHPVLLIWDGLPSHRSKTMTAWLETQRSWLRVERLPAYGHDLNPIEQVWGNLKN